MALTPIETLSLDFLKVARPPDAYTRIFFQNLAKTEQETCRDASFLVTVIVLGDRSNETLDSLLKQLDENCGLDEQQIFQLLHEETCVGEGSPLHEQVKERMAVRLKKKIQLAVQPQQQDASRAQRRM